MLRTGSWVPVFYVMISCDIIAAFMALLWLKPLARRTFEQAELAALAAQVAASDKLKPKAATAEEEEKVEQPVGS